MEFFAGVVFAGHFVVGEGEGFLHHLAGDDDDAVVVAEDEVAGVDDDFAAFDGDVVGGDDAAAHGVDGLDAGGEDGEVDVFDFGDVADETVDDGAAGAAGLAAVESSSPQGALRRDFCVPQTATSPGRRLSTASISMS